MTPLACAAMRGNPRLGFRALVAAQFVADNPGLGFTVRVVGQSENTCGADNVYMGFSVTLVGSASGGRAIVGFNVTLASRISKKASGADT